MNGEEKSIREDLEDYLELYIEGTHE